MFRFRYAYDPRCGGSWWVIEKRFLWFFWLNYKKMPYRLLEDGYPNINQVMDYVDWLNLGLMNMTELKVTHDYY